jgi:hypothetical protein
MLESVASRPLPGRGALSWLVPDSVAYDTEEGEREEREEKDTADVGGECGGRGIVAGSTLAAPLIRGYLALASSRGNGW